MKKLLFVLVLSSTACTGASKSPIQVTVTNNTICDKITLYKTEVASDGSRILGHFTIDKNKTTTIPLVDESKLASLKKLNLNIDCESVNGRSANSLSRLSYSLTPQQVQKIKGTKITVESKMVMPELDELLK